MKPSPYLLQIVYADGSRPVRFAAGGTGERALLQAFASKLFVVSTRAQAVAALKAVLLDLKREALPG